MSLDVAGPESRSSHAPTPFEAQPDGARDNGQNQVGNSKRLRQSPLPVLG